jgi:hypothetical protein
VYIVIVLGMLDVVWDGGKIKNDKKCPQFCPSAFSKLNSLIKVVEKESRCKSYPSGPGTLTMETFSAALPN